MRKMITLNCVALLLIVTAVYGYNCPQEGTFYHADPTTGCQVYHYCENSEMKTFNCPSGQIFDHHTNACADASVTHCEETAHHVHKRSAEFVHSIPIDELKEGLKILQETVKGAVKETVKEVAPTIYERFEDKYAEVVKSVKDDLMPIFHEKVAPRLSKAYDYSKRMGKKIFHKVQESYDLSNSTHLNIVSFSDVVDELSNDIKPVLSLGRYLSARLVPNHSRVKRQAVPEMLLGFMEPVVKEMVVSIGGMFSGQENTLTSKLFVPIITEMVQDPETFYDLQRIFWSSKAAFSPLIYDMLKMQNYRTPEGTVIRIPQSNIDSAKYKFYTETKPILRKVMERHLPMILRRCSENVPLIMSSLERLKHSSGSHVGVLKDSIVRFVSKHGSLFSTSSDKYVNTYTLTEIKRDLKPIEMTLLQILIDYFASTPNSWVGALFNRDSFIYKALLGSDEVYAKPSSDFYTRSKPVSRVKYVRKSSTYKQG